MTETPSTKELKKLCQGFKTAKRQLAKEERAKAVSQKKRIASSPSLPAPPPLSPEQAWSEVRAGLHPYYCREHPDHRSLIDTMIFVRFALRGMGVPAPSVSWDDAQKIVRDTFGVEPRDLLYSRIIYILRKKKLQVLTGGLHGRTAAERRKDERFEQTGKWWDD